MSHLNKLLQKLASHEEPEVVDTDVDDTVDYVYVEKLASAVEFLLDNESLHIKEAAGDMPEPKKDDGDKKDRLKALLSKKKDDAPSKSEDKDDDDDDDDDKDDEKEDKDDDDDDKEEKKAPSKEMVFGSAVNKLRDKLKNKVASAEKTETDSFVEGLVARLQESSHSEKTAKKTEPEVSDAQMAEPDVKDGEEAKEASENEATLAGMLQAAQGGSADSAEESASGGVKTAASQDVSLSNLLKGSLLRRIGQTEDN